jgi:hypothetical protein
LTAWDARCLILRDCDHLEKRGIGFRSLTETIDTTSYLQRSLAIRAGLDPRANARWFDRRFSRRRRGGRRPVIIDEKLRRDCSFLIAQGLTLREATARIKVDKTALYLTLGPKIEGPTAPK